MPPQGARDPPRGAERMTARERIWRWARTRSPFLWILATPLATAPLSLLLLWTAGGEHSAEALGLPDGELCKFQGNIAQTCFFYFDFWRSWALLAIPGALNLLVVLWMLQRSGYVRVAASLALLLGLVRSLVVPMAAIAISQFDLVSDGGLYYRVEIMATGVSGDASPPSEARALRQLLLAAWIGGGVGWVATAAVWQAFEPVMARYWRRLDPPSGPRPEEPRRWTRFNARR